MVTLQQLFLRNFQERMEMKSAWQLILVWKQLAFEFLSRQWLIVRKSSKLDDDG